MNDSDIFIKCNNNVTEYLLDPNDFFISYETTILSSDNNSYTSSDSDISDTITFTCNEGVVDENIDIVEFIDSEEDKQDIMDSDISI